MDVDETDYNSYLAHYGTPRHSGRYPWGSGENPYQRNANFRGYVLNLRNSGMSNAEIAKGMGMTRQELLAKMAQAKMENRAADRDEALRLLDKGYSKSAIGRRMGINESQVRSLLKEDMQIRASKASDTANLLKADLAKNGGYLDIGLGAEAYLGVTQYTLKNAVENLKAEGFEVHNVKVLQAGTGKYTTVQVLCPPDTPWVEVTNNKGDIRLANNVISDDSTRSTLGLERPVAIDPKRVQIRYADDISPDGSKGIDKDGVIELRRGVDDISLGAANYAQVRINVGDSHYLKGMAVYSDNMPPGVDIIFNTNKLPSTPMMGGKDNTVLKPMKKNPETGDVDWDNPFGATIKPEDKLRMAQRYYTDKNGEKKLSAINIVNEEGDWETWAPTLSSQFLSKQLPAVARKQLKLVSDAKQAEFNDIMSLTNPTVKKKLLNEFADECDSAAVHLKAAALPRQSNHVILPVPNLSEKEIYAPNYRDGEQVALVRHPHAGRFEIPILTVNNKSPEGRRVIGQNSPDAVGINSKVAGILSGADFDGDSVLVIPIKGTDLRNRPPLEGLKNFEPKEQYRAYPGMTRVGDGDGFHKQRQMGDISNLITDMTLKGANDREIERAVRHSMVVIDAEKHNLDWRKSYNDNNIAELKELYQGGKNRGASTLISQAKSELRDIPERKEISPDKRTGERRYIETGRYYAEIKDGKKTGKMKLATTTVTKMANAKDARELSSGTLMENIYADHANRLKALANSARKEALHTTAVPYSPSARKAYSKEVAQLEADYQKFIRNKPLERQAQLICDTVVTAKIRANPSLKDKDNADQLKKVRQQALREARARTGAKKNDIPISDKQWEAIQAGALHKTKLESILAAADADRVRELALPKTDRKINTNIIAQVKSMRASGATQAEIADSLGISTTSINDILRD